MLYQIRKSPFNFIHFSFPFSMCFGEPSLLFQEIFYPQVSFSLIQELIQLSSTLICLKVFLLLKTVSFLSGPFWSFLPQILFSHFSVFPKSSYSISFQLIYHHPFLLQISAFSSKALNSLPHAYILTVLLPITLSLPDPVTSVKQIISYSLNKI